MNCRRWSGSEVQCIESLPSYLSTMPAKSCLSLRRIVFINRLISLYLSEFLWHTNLVIEAIKSRRAIRSFEDKPVPDSAIQTMLEAATYAPSAINVQPWKFTIVTNKEAMKQLSDMAKPALIRMLPDVGDEGLVGLKKRLSDPQLQHFLQCTSTDFCFRR